MAQIGISAKSAVQLLLGHSKLEITVRYLGIEVEDALQLAEQTDALSRNPPGLVRLGGSPAECGRL